MSAHYRLRLLYDADLLQLMPMPPQDKKVSDVMTPAQRVFMLEASLCLDYEVMLQIYKSGYTRIPVYEGQTYCYSQPVDIARHRNPDAKIMRGMLNGIGGMLSLCLMLLFLR